MPNGEGSGIKLTGSGMLIQIGKELLKMAILGAAGYVGATFAFSNRLAGVESLQRELLYIQCNGQMPPRARAATPICRQVPIDPQLRALMRDTL